MIPQDEFRKYGHEIVDWIADYLSEVEKYPVKSQVKPGEIKSSVSPEPPINGEPMETIMSDFREKIVPGITHWQHPSWFAYFSSNSSPVSILAEMLTAGLGVQGMIWDTSPSATELEEVVMNWLRDMIGLPDSFTGVIQDTASTATLCAMISAREKSSSFITNQKGFDRTYRVYTSTQTHSSIEKDVKIAGFGKENLIYIETDENYALKPELLEPAIIKDINHGHVPCCVVGTLGSTSSMAMDPIDKIADICSKYGIWFHIDAAFAGTAAIVPEFRSFMKGAEKADSFVFNPHKWMLTNFDCSAYFIKDSLQLQRSFAIMPEYLKTTADSQVNNYRDWGIQLGRRFRSLKLWFVIRRYGVDGIREMIRKHVNLTAKFVSWIENDPNIEITAPVNLTLVCFRLTKRGATEEELAVLNKSLMEMINATGQVYLTHTVLSGKFTLRLAIGRHNTEERHVRLAYDLIRQYSDELLN